MFSHCFTGIWCVQEIIAHKECQVLFLKTGQMLQCLEVLCMKLYSCTCANYLAIIAVIYLTIHLTKFRRCKPYKMTKVIRNQFLIKFSPKNRVKCDSLYIKASTGKYYKVTPPCSCHSHLSLYLGMVGVVYF